MIALAEKPAAVGTHVDLPRVVFVGNPNSGKTTLFNRLTGLRAKTSNFPGTTLEMRSARLMHAEFVDLPGLYSLEGTLEEEQVAEDFLRGLVASSVARTLVVLVVDATRLARNLFLASQIREIASHSVVALNMTDLARREGLEFDLQGLEQALGTRVFPLSARTGEGVPELKAWLGVWLSSVGAAKQILAPCAMVDCVGCDACPYRARFHWAEAVCGKVTRRRERTSVTRQWTDWIDRWTTHPVAGLLIFVAVMAGLFQALFHLAEIPMEWIEDGFEMLRSAAAGYWPSGYWGGFVVNGLLTGLGGLLVFIPQILILFFLISLLEDSGYLARAAVVVDRWMSRVGLPGKAFIPMLSAHACAIPAIMGARAIENRRDRLVTILILPLFSCSARIPVYVMVTAMLFPGAPGIAGLIFTGAYLLGMGAAFAAALVLKGTLLSGTPRPLLIELPDYHLPDLRTALLTAFDRGAIFLRRAGTVIVAIITLLWVATQFPVLPVEAHSFQDQPVSVAAPTEAELERAQLEYSIVGRVGKAVQPVFAPLGFDWTLTVAVLTSFAAREVLVATLSILHGIGQDAGPGGLAEGLRGNIPFATGLSLLVFFILAMQCLPTLVITRRETGAWKWALLQLAYMSAVAYMAAFVTYQISSRLW